MRWLILTVVLLAHLSLAAGAEEVRARAVRVPSLGITVYPLFEPAADETEYVLAWLEVVRSGHTVQRLRVGDSDIRVRSDRVWEGLDVSAQLRLEDMNFDGYPDICLRTHSDVGMHYYEQQVWLYRPETGRFAACPDFRYKSLVRVDRQHRQIITIMFDHYDTYIIGWWEWRAGHLAQVRLQVNSPDSTQTPHPRQSVWSVVVLRGGAWKEVGEGLSQTDAHGHSFVLWQRWHAPQPWDMPRWP